MDATADRALATAERDRERQRLEMRCEFVRGNVFEHPVLPPPELLSFFPPSFVSLPPFRPRCEAGLPHQWPAQGFCGGG